MFSWLCILFWMPIFLNVGSNLSISYYLSVFEMIFTYVILGVYIPITYIFCRMATSFGEASSRSAGYPRLVLNERILSSISTRSVAAHPWHDLEIGMFVLCCRDYNLFSGYVSCIQRVSTISFYIINKLELWY